MSGEINDLRAKNELTRRAENFHVASLPDGSRRTFSRFPCDCVRLDDLYVHS